MTSPREIWSKAQEEAGLIWRLMDENDREKSAGKRVEKRSRGGSIADWHRRTGLPSGDAGAPGHFENPRRAYSPASERRSCVSHSFAKSSACSALIAAGS